jgi:hypothetical protein
MAGDAAAEADAVAAEHYRAALAIVLATDEPLSDAGIVGRIRAAEARRRLLPSAPRARPTRLRSSA